MAPAIVEGALASVREIRGATGRDLMGRLQRNTEAVRRALKEQGIPYLNEDSHIIAIPIGDSHLCYTVCTKLFEESAIYCQPISYPSVGKGESILRITCGPFHTQEDIEKLAGALRDAISICPMNGRRQSQ
jgi:5-aminolevulinate synthase